jgi:two-component system NtrC family response regulator
MEDLSEIKILVIDDEIDVGTFFRRLLKKKDYDVTVAVSGAQASEIIKETSFNVAMVDLKLPDADGLSLLQQIKTLQHNCEVIIMTGYSTTKVAVKAIQLGAFDYLEKPFEDIGEVERLIQKAAEYGLQGYDNWPVNNEWAAIAESVDFQVGTSPAMRRLVSTAYKIANKSINILIQGETGTGKEVLAKFIHAASSRSNSIFIPVNCGALPENLLESELFGHEKGSFTGAGNMRRGIFEMADQGTLFLDEVGESSLGIQVKLLRVLETGEFYRVGGEHPIKTDVRVIAASNVDLEQAMKEKTFREDLFYRLDVVRLEIPPLRARQEDIPLLSEYFVKKMNADQRISIGVMRLLCNYSWPGNIRELSNTIRQAVALCDDKIILPGHLPLKLRQLVDEQDVSSAEQQWLHQINSCLEAMAKQVDITAGFELPVFMDGLKKSISHNVRDLISRALLEAYGQYPQAAEWFRTTPRVLRYLHDEKQP